jgi:long-subunit fatty acid transport protein
MKKLAYIISIVLFASFAYAQDMTDALRYSNYQINGTSRSQAMGNAFGSLGGDFTSLSINPAGAAVYRSSEFTFTTGLNNSKADGNYNGSTAFDSDFNVSINNMGYVAAIPTGENSESGLVNINIGMGYNRLGNFNTNYMATGSDMQSSLMKYFTYNANNPLTAPENLYPYYEGLAWETYMLNFDEQNNEYFNDITDNNYGQSLRKSTQREGHINEFLFTLAANFNHKFYLGGTFGIHDVYFREDVNIYEYDANGNIPYFNEFNFGTTLSTSGYGFNFKMGAIYKPSDNLRFGFAFHIPTFYHLDDYYNSYMNSSITYLSDGITENYKASPEEGGVYDYEIQTPFKYILSGSYIVGKSGLISVDYEILDYSKAKISHGSDGYDFYNENEDINNAYRTTGNLHIGGEYRVNSNVSLRAGYENYGNAFDPNFLDNNNQDPDKAISTYSGGIGYKYANFFLDFTYQHVSGQETLKLYPDINANEMVQYDTKQNNMIFTLGLKF